MEEGGKEEGGMEEETEEKGDRGDKGDGGMEVGQWRSGRSDSDSWGSISERLQNYSLTVH